MKKILQFFPLFSLIIVLAGCSDEQTTVQIIRTPSLTFSFNNTSSWKADNYSFPPVSKVVVYPQDTSLPGQLYNRFSLQATGRDSTGNTYQLFITFDAIDINQLSGVYSPFYTSQKGLSEVQIYNLTNNNNLSAYNLCAAHLANAVFQVQKQNINERLITGTFQMTLCNSRDSTDKINITNGIMKDIKY